MKHRVLFWYGTAVVILSAPVLATDTVPNSIRPDALVTQRTAELGTRRGADQLTVESLLHQPPVHKLSLAAVRFLAGMPLESRVEQTALGFSGSAPRQAMRADWESNFAGIAVTKSARDGSPSDSSLVDDAPTARPATSTSENRIEASSSTAAGASE